MDGGGAPSPLLTCAPVPGAARRGAGRGQRGPQMKLCCSRDGAVVTSSPSGRRGPGFDPAARAVARRALQPPARPRARGLGCRLPGCAPSAPGRSGRPSARSGPLSGKGLPQPGRVGAEEVQTSLSSALGGGVGVRGAQRAEAPGETHSAHKQSRGGGRGESFAVWCCPARRSCQKAECSRVLPNNA